MQDIDDKGYCMYKPAPREHCSLHTQRGEKTMFTSFLIKYAEIGVKGKNRYLFEDALVHQIKFALKKVEGKFLISKTQGRIFVETEGEFDYEDTIEH